MILLHLPVEKLVLVSTHKKLGCLDVKESAYSLPIIGKVTSSLIHYRSIIEKLGKDKMAKIKIIGIEEVKRSSYGQLVLGEGVASDLGEQLAKEARKAGKFPQTIWFNFIAQSAKISWHKLVASLCTIFQHKKLHTSSILF